MIFFVIATGVQLASASQCTTIAIHHFAQLKHYVWLLFRSTLVNVALAHFSNAFECKVKQLFDIEATIRQNVESFAQRIGLGVLQQFAFVHLEQSQSTTKQNNIAFAAQQTIPNS